MNNFHFSPNLAGIHKAQTQAPFFTRCLFVMLLPVFLLTLTISEVLAQAQTPPFSIRDFMGVNLRRQDPVQYTNCVGFAREYHDWVIDAGDFYLNQTCPNFFEEASDPYPNNSFRWSPGYQGQSWTRFGQFYADLTGSLNNGQARPICSTMKFCLPGLSGGSGKYGTSQDDCSFNTCTGASQEFIPVQHALSYMGNGNSCGVNNTNFPASNTDPAAYIEYADWVHHFSAAFAGSNAGYAPQKRAAGDDTGYGQNQVGYVEIWNEQDKNWYDLSTSYFEPAEYAAMASFTFDGWNGTTHLIANDGQTGAGHEYNLGVSNAGGGAGYVFGGLWDIDTEHWNYLTGVRNQLNTLRAGVNEADHFVFDAINFHHYCDRNSQGLGAKGFAPEEDWMTDGNFTPEVSNITYQGTPLNRTFKMRLREIRDLANTAFPGRELWLSEFGYDTNESSDQHVEPIPAANGQPFADREEVQGRYLVRTYLEVAAANWDRAIQFCIRDVNSNPAEGARYDASGIVKDFNNEYAPKKAYWYTSTMHRTLGDYRYCQELNAFTTTTATPAHDPGLRYEVNASRPRAYLFETGNPVCPFTEYPTTISQGDIIAFWLSTSAHNAFNYGTANPFLFRQAAGQNITQATIITMTPGDPDGVQRSVNVTNGPNGYRQIVFPADIPITERPLFVRLGQGVNDPNLANACPLINLQNSRSLSCDAILVAWTDPVLPAPFTDFSFYRVYYYDRRDSEEGTGVPAFDIADLNWKLYGTVPGNTNSVVIGGLNKLQDNYFVAIEGVIVDQANGGIQYVSPVCVQPIPTAACFGGIDPAIIQNLPANTSAVVDALFNYDIANICYPPRDPFNDVWDEFAASPLTITVAQNGQPLHLDAIGLFDGSSEGEMTVEFLDNALPTPNVIGSFTYFSAHYNTWRYIPVNIPQGVHSIRLVRTAGHTPRIGRIKLFGFWGAGYPVIDCCGNANSITIGSIAPPIGNVNMGSLNSLVDNGVLPLNWQNATQNIVIQGNLTIDIAPQVEYGFSSNSRIWADNGAAIMVNAGRTFRVQNGTLIQGCETMWRGIVQQPGSSVFVDGNSTVRDAEFAIRVNRWNNTNPQTAFMVADAFLEMNKYGVFVEKSYVGANDVSNLSSVQRTTFDAFGMDLKPPYVNFQINAFQLNWWATPHSGVLTNNCNMITVGGDTDHPTRFRNMFNGIFSGETNMLVNSSEFQNLRPGQIPNPYILNAKATFGGMGINGWNGWLNQTGFGGASNSRVSFQNVERPIEISYMHRFNISLNRMEQVDRAIRASLTKPSIFQGGVLVPNNVENNYLRPTQNGVELFFNTQPGIKVLNNNIATAGNFTTRAVTALGFTSPLPNAGNNTNSPNQVYDIRDNIIEIRSDVNDLTVVGAGVYVNDVNKANIEHNTITVNNFVLNTGTNPPQPVIYGILQTNSKLNTICTNNITGWLAAPPLYGHGLFSENSTNYTISCNVTSQLREGLGFRLNCSSPSTDPNTGQLWKQGVLGNSMTNQHLGMFLDNTGGAAAVGDQERTGNRWVGTFPNFTSGDPGFAALYEMPSAIDLQSNRFLIHQNASAEFDPADIDPIIGWFVDVNNPSFYNCNTAPNPCASNHLNIIRTPDGEYYRKVAKGQLDFSGFTAARQWMLQRDVYREAKVVFGETTTDPDYATFYSNMSGTTVQAYYDVENAIAELADWEPAIRTQVSNLEQQIDSIIRLDLPELEAFHAQPVKDQQSQIMNGTAPQLFSGLAARMESKWALEAELKTSFANRVAKIKDMNDGLSSTEPYEQKEKEMNGIFLNSILADSFLLADGKLADVEAIADLCPQDAGFAVYRARAIFTAETGIVKALWEECYDRLQERSAQSGSENSDKEFPFQVMVYPNPANSHLYVEIFGNEGEKYDIRLLNAQGKMLVHSLLRAGRYGLDWGVFPAGIYLLQVKDAEGRVSTTKVVLSK